MPPRIARKVLAKVHLLRHGIRCNAAASFTMELQTMIHSLLVFTFFPSRLAPTAEHSPPELYSSLLDNATATFRAAT